MKRMLLYQSLIISTLIIDCVMGSFVTVSIHPTQPEVGKSVLLDCSFRDAPTGNRSNIHVDWTFCPDLCQKTQTIFYYYSNRDVSVNNRTRWVGDVTQDNGSIVLTDLWYSDSGNYTCEVRLNNLIHKGQTVTKVNAVRKARPTLEAELESHTSQLDLNDTWDPAYKEGRRVTVKEEEKKADWLYVITAVVTAVLVIGFVAILHLWRGRRAGRNNTTVTRPAKEVRKGLSETSRSSQENVYSVLHTDKRKDPEVEEQVKKQQQQQIRDDAYMTMDDVCSMLYTDKGKDLEVEEQVMKKKTTQQQNDAYMTMHPLREPSAPKPSLMDLHLYEKLEKFKMDQTGERENESDPTIPGSSEEGQC